MQMLIAGGRNCAILILFFSSEKIKSPRWRGARNGYSLANAATFHSIKARGAYQRGNKFIHSVEAFEKA